MGTVIGAHEVTVDLATADDDLWVDAADLDAATGWVLKPEGLCRGDICVPVRDRTALVDAEGRVGLRAFARSVGHVVALDLANQVAVLGDGGRERRDALETLEAPDLALEGLDGRTHQLSEWNGRKRALVAWASWCGCRHELAAWQELRAELAPSGFELVSVALDDGVDAARPWVDASDPTPEYPVLVDPDHRFVEAFGVVNVPSVVWIDEEDRVVRAPVIAPGDDQFRDFTEIDSRVHHDQLRAWVHDGQVPEPDDAAVRAALNVPSDDLQQARVERRLAAWLHRHGHEDQAAAAIERAVALAPLDFTIARSSLWQRGADPFGTEFFEMWDRWVEAGRPGYTSAAGPPPVPSSEPG